MKYYKFIENGYIAAIGTNCGGTEISEDDYASIKTVLKSKPSRTGTTDYRLRDDLTWEAYEIEPPDPDPDIDDAELLTILMGGAAE